MRKKIGVSANCLCSCCKCFREQKKLENIALYGTINHVLLLLLLLVIRTHGARCVYFNVKLTRLLEAIILRRIFVYCCLLVMNISWGFLFFYFFLQKSSVHVQNVEERGVGCDVRAILRETIER